MKKEDIEKMRILEAIDLAIKQNPQILDTKRIKRIFNKLLKLAKIDLEL